MDVLQTIIAEDIAREDHAYALCLETISRLRGSTTDLIDLCMYKDFIAAKQLLIEEVGHDRAVGWLSERFRTL